MPGPPIVVRKDTSAPPSTCVPNCRTWRVLARRCGRLLIESRNRQREDTTAASTSTSASSAATSTTANPNDTPNPIPYVVGEQIGLANNWLVTVVEVHLHDAPAGLAPAGSGKQYVAIDIRMKNQGPTTYTVDANTLFTLVDTAHQELFVIPVPGTANGIDGRYATGTARTGRLVFKAPIGQDLGLVLYGPRIGSQVSDFAIVPPTVPNN